MEKFVVRLRRPNGEEYEHGDIFGECYRRECNGKLILFYKDIADEYDGCGNFYEIICNKCGCYTEGD